jgi:hypothetical protein
MALPGDSPHGGLLFVILWRPRSSFLPSAPADATQQRSRGSARAAGAQRPFELSEVHRSGTDRLTSEHGEAANLLPAPAIAHSRVLAATTTAAEPDTGITRQQCGPRPLPRPAHASRR